MIHLTEEGVATLLPCVAVRVAADDRTPAKLVVAGLVATPQKVEQVIRGAEVISGSEGLTFRGKGDSARVLMALELIIADAVEAEIGAWIRTVVR